MISDGRLTALIAWVTGAGLRGESELALLTGFCDRAVAAGLPLMRAQVLIDTLDPIHEGHVFRWGHGSEAAPEHAYGRTGDIQPSHDNVDMWRTSAFYRMRETGESFLRRRLPAADEREFLVLGEMTAAGFTDYVALINRFDVANCIGEMDCVYSSWSTTQSGGFTDEQLAALQHVTPFLALAVKSASLARMCGTLMQTYLGRDASRRVLNGRIMRGITDTIDAVLWFSDLRGFTRITDTTPEHAIPLLNDYADAIVSAIHDHRGDVLKLIGDGVLAIFNSEDRVHSSMSAMAAAVAARQGVLDLNGRRAAASLPTTDIYLALHVGEVFYGNVGSTERLDFTVIGPAVNEVSRIAAMCRSVEQPMLMSAPFADIGNNRGRLVSVGRYALRGVRETQELFTLDQNATF
jgi:adenylate cyclase